MNARFSLIKKIALFCFVIALFVSFRTAIAQQTALLGTKIIVKGNNTEAVATVTNRGTKNDYLVTGILSGDGTGFSATQTGLVAKGGDQAQLVFSGLLPGSEYTLVLEGSPTQGASGPKYGPRVFHFISNASNPKVTEEVQVTTTPTQPSTTSTTGPSTSTERGTGLLPCINDCHFEDVFILINTLIEKAITIVVLPIFIVLLMYCGYLYITSWGDSKIHGKVQNIMKNAIFGLLIVLCSWLIVKVIISAIGYTPGLKYLE